MSVNVTNVGWTDLTWNLWSGCRKVSPECKFCYAEALTEQRRGLPAAPHGFELTVRPKNLRDPATALKRFGPSLIFCESMSDIGLDDAELTVDERARLQAAGYATLDSLRLDFFTAIERSPDHRYQILTKRPQRLLRFVRDYLGASARRVLASCWIGVTIGHERSLSRLPDLLAFRDLGARVLFISAEPLLCDLVGAGLKLDGVDWLIAGGESGTHIADDRHAGRFIVYRPGRKAWVPRARAWVARLRDEAARVGCAFFFKQWGGPKPDSTGRLLDGVEYDGMPSHVHGVMPERRVQIDAATAALSRKKSKTLPVSQ